MKKIFWLGECELCIVLDEGKKDIKYYSKFKKFSKKSMEKKKNEISIVD